MWTLTERINGTTKEVKTLEYINVDGAVRLYKSLGYTVDELFTMPEWNRYTFLKYREGDGLIELILEWEEE